MLSVIDEFTRECLAIRVDRKLRSTDVIDALSDLFILLPARPAPQSGPAAPHALALAPRPTLN